ncbi:MAG: RNA pseudouridine synthase [Chlorobi bacterium]|nr:RNA pseudouridine synthase [Chlorobiota bacterium]
MEFQPSDLNIIYEDNHLIAVNKTNSDLVQSDKTGDLALNEKVKIYLKEKYKKPGNVFLGVIHRIDRPVSGIVLFAKTGKALSRMNEKIKKREIEKTYWAIVANKPEQEKAELKNFLTRNRKQNKSYAYEKPVPDSKEATLEYQLIGTSERYYFLSINLITGRHHQIRCQLAKIGCPIKGDLKYGYPRSNSNGGINLHAYQMSFLHPVTKEKTVLTALPPNEVLWEVLQKQSN